MDGIDITKLLSELSGIRKSLELIERRLSDDIIPYLAENKVFVSVDKEGKIKSTAIFGSPHILDAINTCSCGKEGVCSCEEGYHTEVDKETPEQA